MTGDTQPLTGVIRGNTIELDRPSGLPDGHRVTVMLHPPPRNGAGASPPDADPHPAFAAWADDADALEASLQQARRDGETDRNRETDRGHPGFPDRDIQWPEGLR